MERTIDRTQSGEPGGLSISDALAAGSLRCAERIVGVLPDSGLELVDAHLRNTVQVLCTPAQGADGDQLCLGLVILGETAEHTSASSWLPPVLRLAETMTMESTGTTEMTDSSHVAIVDLDRRQPLTAAFGLDCLPGVEDVASAATSLASVMYDVDGFDRVVVVGRGSSAGDGSSVVSLPEITGALRAASYQVVVMLEQAVDQHRVDLIAAVDALVVLVGSMTQSALELDRQVDELVSAHQLPVGIVICGMDIAELADNPVDRLSGAAIVRERASRDAQDVAQAISSAWNPTSLNRSSSALTAVVPDELSGLIGRDSADVNDQR